ncbi:MAG: nickel pincer cofactor biosynthesis protein LarC [Oscillospiraceae bacterium]|nr:nickel pincer cofactor biosynthesis protein LarC [Oscillospiraceae bacterium]
MKTLYLDCGMGAAGDMLAAALLELLPDPERMLETLNGLGLPGVEFRREKVLRNGISGSRMRVRINGAEEDDRTLSQEHTGLERIEGIVASCAMPPRVREDVLSVFHLLAGAESKVHGCAIPDVHFHEIGTMDAIADIAAVCMILRELAPERILSSGVHVGCGHVRCEHGVLPVPAPATAELLKGVPIYGGRIEGELCTPTGAALLKHFVTRFGDMPPLEIDRIGYGMGKKEFEQLNCLRALLGRSAEETDRVSVLSCNVDDMSAEEIGFATERLLAAGARDVYTLPLGMKKNRPGAMICVICGETESERFASELFRYTSTIGIRKETVERYLLSRSEDVRDTKYGPVRIKRAQGYGADREKLEYEDLARIAREQGKSLAQIRRELEAKA